MALGGIIWPAGAKLKQELGDFKKLSDPAAKDEVAAAQAKAKDYLVKVFKNTNVLDPSACAATNTFIQREIGDVLITWENEAFLASESLGKGEYEIVVPKVSILAEPPVAVVDRNVDKSGTRDVAEAYLKHLYSPAGQQLAAKHHYRPADSALISEDERNHFAQVELFTIDDVFGGWKKAQAEHFADGGAFDDILKTAKQ
ncbi:MAG: sulfate ABC transporter substrate-binding protein [Pirellulales bacterium]